MAAVRRSPGSGFAPGRVPVIGRFALAGGQPYAADAAHTVRSMAILFQAAGGEEMGAPDEQHPGFRREQRPGLLRSIARRRA